MCISKRDVFFNTFALIKSIASLRHNLTAIATPCSPHNLNFSDLIDDLPHTQPYFAKDVTIGSVASSGSVTIFPAVHWVRAGKSYSGYRQDQDDRVEPKQSPTKIHNI